MRAWMDGHATLFWWLAAVSVVVFVASMILVPILVVRMPADYFKRGPRPPRWANHHPIARAALVTGRTVLGVALLLAGVVMLVLPGQGILAMVAGVMLLEFPGKERVERWIISRGPVIRSINWLRKRGGRSPLEID